MIAIEFHENSESGMWSGVFGFQPRILGCKMEVTMVWYRVRVSESLQHIHVSPPKISSSVPPRIHLPTFSEPKA